MKKIWKKVYAVILSALIAVSCAGVTAAYADEAYAVWPAGPEVGAASAIVMEANTGTVLYEKNADEQHYPASITKIMTTLLAIENCPLDETVTFSAKAVFENEGDSSHISRDLGEEMTLEQCLYGTMLESANECAWAVAEHIGGGDAGVFVNMMNERAEELGCTGTHFSNPNGLPDETHVTTCRDMALISQAAIQNSIFRKITGTVKYSIPPTNKHEVETPLNNHHQMLSSYKGTKNLYEYCIGGKTGYTVAAGNTLVTFAEKDDMLLICVVMNAGSTHYTDTRTLFDYCFSNYKMYNVSQNEMRYSGSQNRESSLFQEVEPFARLDMEAEIVLPATADFNDTETEISHDNDSDSVIGTLVYTYGGKTVGTADVITTGASAQSYEFGKKITSSDDGGSANAENTVVDQDRSSSSGSSGVRVSLRKIIIVVVIVVAALLVLLYLYNNIRRYIRRKRSRDRRYKTIKENRKWNRRRRRR